MIYFAQDSDTLHIKIGVTDQADAGSRLRALQTGNPSPLVLLGTMPGDRDTERQLHQRFASARVAGEWFRPVPSLLALLLEHRAYRAIETAPRAGTGRQAARHLVPPLRIYLAGKIDKNCWRHGLVSGLRTALDDQDAYLCPTAGRPAVPVWPILPRSIFGVHDYVGPFFASCDHGCFHGDDCHGFAAAVTEFQEGEHHDGILGGPEVVLNLCLLAIHNADLLFAWIDSLDCYGTVVEVGYARALGTRIFIAGPRPFRDMWFVHETAGAFFSAGSPEHGLRAALLNLQCEEVL